MIKTMIPTGVRCCQDLSVFRWPRPTDDPSTVFMGQKLQGGGVRLVAPGYGEPGNYGRGAIFVSRQALLVDINGVPYGQ